MRVWIGFFILAVAFWVGMVLWLNSLYRGQ